MDQQNKPVISQDENNLCAFCQNFAQTRCAGCLKVYYCSKEHQKLDWKIHAKNCSVLKLVKDTSGQRHYVATRDIKVGEIVYNEKEPIVMGPASYFRPSCVSCCVELASFLPCKTCGWPLCPDCTTHGPECGFTTKFLKKKIRITNIERPIVIYDIVVAARSLALKTDNPSAYNKLVKLRARTENGPVYSKICEKTQVLRQSLLKLAPERNLHLENEIFTELPVLKYHGHIIAIRNGMALAVYKNVRYFKNDCTSNCTKIISDIGGISIRAVTPIAKGENVTICYTDPSFHAMSRRKLLSLHFINCQCKRCKDPTEFGTMYNTVKCIKKDCDGYMLPPTFIADDRCKNFPDFVCDKCNARVPALTVDDMITKDEKEWLRLESSECRDILKYKQILEKQRKIFHEGHASILCVKLLIVTWIEYGLEKISDELLNEYVKYFEEVAENLKVLMPSDTVTRGICIFRLFSTRYEYFRRNEHTHSSMQKEKFQEDLMKMIFECHDLLCNEDSMYGGLQTEILDRMKQMVAKVVSDNRELYNSYCQSHV